MQQARQFGPRPPFRAFVAHGSVNGIYARQFGGLVPTALAVDVQEVFADVPAASPYCRWVEELVRRGVVAGCGGGLYCPSQGVSGEQLAVYLLKTLEGLPYVRPACGTPIFTDVPASSPFCPFIEELNRRAVVGGCSPGLCCPTRVVVRDGDVRLPYRYVRPYLVRSLRAETALSTVPPK